jgi:hypothetical protein
MSNIESNTTTGHYWLSQMRSTNPDPAMQNLPPLPASGSNALPFVSNNVGTAAPPAAAAAASTNGYWLGRLRDAETAAQRGTMPQ